MRSGFKVSGIKDSRFSRFSRFLDPGFKVSGVRIQGFSKFSRFLGPGFKVSGVGYHKALTGQNTIPQNHQIHQSYIFAMYYHIRPVLRYMPPVGPFPNQALLTTSPSWSILPSPQTSFLQLSLGTSSWDSVCLSFGINHCVSLFHFPPNSTPNLVPNRTQNMNLEIVIN
jgi:hypothetical protein